ncbi:MAG: virulence factor TspB C-terminal domain-related protein [Burkholderiaceae bacterium]
MGGDVDHLRALVALFLILCSGAVHAGYAQPAPPSNWRGSPGNWTATSANASSYYPGGWRGPGGVINVAGRQVTIPAAYRTAANASRYAASWIFRNPWAWGIAAVATWVGSCIKVQGGQWVWTCGVDGTEVSDGKQYAYYEGGAPYAWRDSLSQACADGVARYWARTNLSPRHQVGQHCALGSGASYVEYELDEPCCGGLPKGHVGRFAFDITSRSGGTCPEGWFILPGGECVQTPQPQLIPEPDFTDKPGMPGTKPYPPGLPGDLPDMPLPQLPPIINPTPGDNPGPQPWFVPTGDPTPTPGTDPQRWTQPGLNINPANDDTNPWQVDIEPIQLPWNPGMPTGPRLPWVEGDPPVQPDPDADFCRKNPTVIACQTFVPDEIDATPVPDVERKMSIAKDDGYGPSNGSCPAPRTASVRGISLSMPFDLLCSFAQSVRPLFISLAWLSAALSFIGLGRKGGA